MGREIKLRAVSLAAAAGWVACSALLASFALRAGDLAAVVRGFVGSSYDPTWERSFDQVVGSSELAWGLAALAVVLALALVLRPGRLAARSGLLLAAFTIPYSLWLSRNDSVMRTQFMALAVLCAVAAVLALVATRWAEAPSVAPEPRPWVMPPPTHQG